MATWQDDLGATTTKSLTSRRLRALEVRFALCFQDKIQRSTNFAFWFSISGAALMLEDDFAPSASDLFAPSRSLLAHWQTEYCERVACELRKQVDRIGGAMGLYLSCACNSVFAAPDDRKPHKLTRNQIAIVNKLLPSFPYYVTSTTSHRLTAAAFWNEAFFEVAPPSSKSTNSKRSTGNNSQGSTRISQLYDTFYSFLDHNSPALKPIFRSSMVVRSKVLVHISAGLRSILVGDNMIERVESLTRTHLRLGVKMEHYDPLGVALLFAMKECSGALWTPQVEEAWRRIYAHCCVILLDAHRRMIDQQTTKAREIAKGASPNINDLQSNLRPHSIKENSIAPASATTSANNVRANESA